MQSLALRNAPIRKACSRALTVSARAMAAPTTPVTVFVKGYQLPGGDRLGDCPFSQRVLLTLEAKKLPYKVELIDFDHKPQWLLDLNGGKVPVIKETPDSALMPDSDVITAHLEEKYPEPSLKPKAPAGLGSKLMPSYRVLIMGPDSERPAKEADLMAELKAINDYLAANGPLFGGDHLDAVDASLGPKLNICVVALKHFRKWELPAEFSAIRRYLDTVKNMPEWQRTDGGDDMIIRGWQRHLDGK